MDEAATAKNSPVVLHEAQSWGHADPFGKLVNGELHPLLGYLMEAAVTNRRDTPPERLRGSVIKYEGPLEPAAKEEDWAMLGTDEPEEHITIAVWRVAIELFGGDRTAADRWLHHEAMGLGWKRPIDVMQDDPQQVLDLIARIEHGVCT